jgi:hypothetical protein
LVKIDESLKNELLSLYDKDKMITKALGAIDEVSSDLGQRFKNDIGKEFVKPESKQSKSKHAVVAALATLKKKEIYRRAAEKASLEARSKTGEVEEMTGAASSGAFTAPLGGGDVVKREMPEIPVVGETTTVASAGNFQYDTPGLANVGGNGDFKKPKKTKAEKTPQWAGGSFVKQPECSKLNNNKEAQNGGCNQGASSLHIVKGKGSVNAPSLAENTILEEIAKKTGKTIEEVKKIIDSKIKR